MYNALLTLPNQVTLRQNKYTGQIYASDNKNYKDVAAYRDGKLAVYTIYSDRIVRHK